MPVWEAVAAHLPPLDRSGPGRRRSRGIAYLPSGRGSRCSSSAAGTSGRRSPGSAAEVDFEIWVLDDRERFASRELLPRRRPAASSATIGETLRDLVPQLTAATYALIVTRGHNHDEEALYHLADEPRAATSA